MDERVAAFLRQYGLPQPAYHELQVLIDTLVGESHIYNTYESAQDSTYNNFDQTLSDPKQTEELLREVAKKLKADEAQAAVLFEDDSEDDDLLADTRQTSHSLPPFQAIQDELEQWNSQPPQQDSPAGARPLSMPEALSSDLFTPSPPSKVPMRQMSPTERYEDLGLLGEGGMGEVRRVRDKQLKRVVAMKVIRQELKEDFSLSIRFIEEAQATAQLQHPAIIPLHDIGQLDDGRLYFTMKEIKGKTLEEVIETLHKASKPHGRWVETEEGWTIRRVLDAFRDVCEAVGYAHSRGVLHRDLKPENVMLGAYGEVLVLDWGLVKVKGHVRKDAKWGLSTDEIVVTDRSQEDEYVTMIGAITGTPTYMPPEQAKGAENLDARSDVYALGAVLYEILSGRPPYYGDDHDAVVAQLLKGPPPALLAQDTNDFLATWDADKQGGGQQALPISSELVNICNKAMDRNPNLRYNDANDFAKAIAAWLEGAQKRERAQSMVREANDKMQQAEQLHEQAIALHARAREHLDKVKPWEPEAAKHTGWSLEDEASRVEREATLKELESELSLQSALVHDPFLLAARSTLANNYRRIHHTAELEGNDPERIRAEQMLFNHLQAIAPSHPDFKDHLAYLKGDGALTLITDPPGAEVTVYRYVEQNRRLVPVRSRSLGVTPLFEQSLPMGSYLLLLRKEGYEDIRYPVHIRRQEHWHSIAPGDDTPYPIVLPKQGELSTNECYVPPGWFWSGGDPEAVNGLEARRLWLDGFIMRRFPITHAEYISFLNTLLEEEREQEATRYIPKTTNQQFDQKQSLYGRSKSGFFIPRPLSSSSFLEEPVTHIALSGARAFAQWLTTQTGLMWCLPDEFEWEKAARGTDGRFFPWGNKSDPSWCCMQQSHQGEPIVYPIESWPLDESPYGIRGMAGNVKDWCANPYRQEGPRQAEISVRTLALSATGTLKGFDNPLQDAFDDVAAHTIRGGSWKEADARTRTASRRGGPPDNRYDNVGFRIIRYL